MKVTGTKQKDEEENEEKSEEVSEEKSPDELNSRHDRESWTLLHGVKRGGGRTPRWSRVPHSKGDCGALDRIMTEP
jgi:hypothetical protein